MSEKLKKLVLPPNPNKITFLKPRDIEVGASVSGYYLESREDQYGKPGHKLKTSEGKIVVNSATNLDDYMAMLEPGPFIRITRIEDEIITGGPHKGKPKFMFEVAIVEDVEPLTAEQLEEELAAEEEAQEKRKPSPRKPGLSKVK